MIKIASPAGAKIAEACGLWVSRIYMCGFEMSARHVAGMKNTAEVSPIIIKQHSGWVYRYDDNGVCAVAPIHATPPSCTSEVS